MEEVGTAAGPADEQVEVLERLYRAEYTGMVRLAFPG